MQAAACRMVGATLGGHRGNWRQLAARGGGSAKGPSCLGDASAATIASKSACGDHPRERSPASRVTWRRRLGGLPAAA